MTNVLTLGLKCRREGMRNLLTRKFGWGNWSEWTRDHLGGEVRFRVSDGRSIAIQYRLRHRGKYPTKQQSQVLLLPRQIEALRSLMNSEGL